MTTTNQVSSASSYRTLPYYATFGLESPKGIEAELIARGIHDLYVPPIDPDHVFCPNFCRDVRSFMSHASGDILGIVGPTGSGKTSGINQFAARTNWPIVEQAGSASLEFDRLIGHFRLVQLNKGEPPMMMWIDGPLLRAMKTGSIFVLHEADQVCPEQMIAFNDLVELRRVSVPELGGQVIVAEPDFRVVFTSNTNFTGDTSGSYPGAQAMSIALTDRITWTFVDYLDPVTEAKILEKKVPNCPAPLREKALHLANHYRASFTGNNKYIKYFSDADGSDATGIDSRMSRPMSNRTLIRYCKKKVSAQGREDLNEYALTRSFLHSLQDDEVDAALRIAKDIYGNAWSIN